MVERAKALAPLEFDADAMVELVKDLAARADAFPLPPSSSHAMTHERR
jgi:hypothetical protein